MAILDIFKTKKGKADEKLKRPSKGVLKKSDADQKVKPTEKKEVVKVAKTTGSKAKEGNFGVASIVLGSPHITEKASFLSEKGVYVFKVSKRANKIMIKKAIKELYGFDPIKVNITNKPSKTKVSRGRKGVRPGYKKAVIYLKKGDEISIA